MCDFDQSFFDSVVAPRLTAALIEETGISPAEAAASVRDYGRFLALIPAARSATCPPSWADRAWHAHQGIEGYDADCRHLCGRPLTHDAEAFGTPEFAAAWGNTRARWAAAYGENLEADPTVADCGRLAPAMCNEPWPPMSSRN